jgi:hypothetical protein
MTDSSLALTSNPDVGGRAQPLTRRVQSAPVKSKIWLREPKK